MFLLNSNQCLGKNNWKVENLLLKLIALRSYILPIIQNIESEHYLDLREKYSQTVVKQDCKNILLVFEISLIIPFANAKVEARKFVGQQQHHKST